MLSENMALKINTKKTPYLILIIVLGSILVLPGIFWGYEFSDNGIKDLNFKTHPDKGRQKKNSRRVHNRR